MYTALIRIQQQRQPCNSRNVSRFSCILNQFKLMGQQRPITLVRQMQEPARFLIQPQKSQTLPQHLSTLSNQDDYRIYQQNIDLDAFFGEEQKYEKVSDVCLLNDHFILVKMPPMPKEMTTPIAPATDSVPRKSKLPRCFKCSRSSRISPILEDDETKQLPQISNQLPSWSSKDQDEVEVFNSTTRVTLPPHQHQHHHREQPQTSVIVEQPLPSSPLKLDAIQPTNHVITRAPVHWFLWPFRRRRRDVSKSQAQLAAVHKTYFVNWAKPPETLWHGYGVDKGEMETKNYKLRRCRSSTF